MALRFIGIDPNTGHNECPTVWYDDDREEFVFQGRKAGEELLEKCLETGSIPDTEAVVRLPARMAQMIKEAVDAAERAPLR
ncbi:hypothetical protein [Streptomyces sp. NPDC021096]|uniref:hypothetical protein n=1 Tax=Streptomyces sp. NPDC021096 TaxID=3154792 RepID=UPI0033EEE9B4